MSTVEEIRQSFKPQQVSVLFVGESAPARGTFFYLEDSLCTYTREAFAMAFPGLVPASAGKFLRFFQQSGCYLDDLSLVPVNDRAEEDRRRLQLEGMPELAKRMRIDRPQAIICMLKDKTFQSIIQEAARRAGLADIPFRITPFGGFGNQGKYREELRNHLVEFQSLGILKIAEKY